MPSDLSIHTSGEMQACFAAIFALIHTHPNPQAFAQWLNMSKEVFIARLSNQAIPEGALTGFYEAMERFESTAASALNNQRGA
jgi:hypothetical protein